MTVVIILNIFLGATVIIGVVAPLIWAIVTQNRDEPDTVLAKVSSAPPVPVRVTRRRRRRVLEPIVWPTR